MTARHAKRPAPARKAPAWDALRRRDAIPYGMRAAAFHDGAGDGDDISDPADVRRDGGTLDDFEVLLREVHAFPRQIHWADGPSIPLRGIRDLLAEEGLHGERR